MSKQQCKCPVSRIVSDRLGLSRIRVYLRLAGRVQGLLLLANAPSVRLGHTRLDQVVHYCNVLRACNCVHVQFTLSIPPMFLCCLPLLMLLLFRVPFAHCGECYTSYLLISTGCVQYPVSRVYLTRGCLIRERRASESVVCLARCLLSPVLRKEEREKSDLALFFHRRLLLRRLRSVPRRNILRRYRRARAALLALGMAWPDERAAWEIRTGAARIGKMRAREMQPPFIARSIHSLTPSPLLDFFDFILNLLPKPTSPLFFTITHAAY